MIKLGVPRPLLPVSAFKTSLHCSIETPLPLLVPPSYSPDPEKEVPPCKVNFCNAHASKVLRDLSSGLSSSYQGPTQHNVGD